MKDIAPIVTLRFFSSLADQALVYGIPIIVFQKTGSIAASGFAFAIEWIPRLIAMPICGVGADIFGPRRTLITADIFRFFTVLIVGIFLFFDLSSFFVVMIFGLLGGSVGFFHEMAFVSFESLAPRIVSKDDLAKLQSVLQGIDLGTQILAPGLAAFLLSQISILSFLIVISFLFLFSFLGSKFSKSLISVSLDEKNIKKIKNFYVEVKTQMSEGIKFIIHSKALLSLCTIAISMNFSIGFLLSGSPGFLKEGLEMNAQMAGALGTLAGIIGLCGFLFIPFYLKFFSLKSLGLIGIIIFFLSNVLIYFSNNFYYYAIFYAFLFLADGFYSVYMRTYRASLIPRNIFSSVIGIILCVNFIFMPLSGLILGFVGNSAYSFKYILLFSALFFGIVSLISYKNLEFK